MNDLIDLNELYSVLLKIAEDVRENYKEHLDYNGRYTTRHALIDSVKTQVVSDGQAYEVTMTLNNYWKYVEEGVRGDKNPSSPYKNPGWKAFPHILEWIQIKPILPRPDRSGRVPTEKQLAYLITRSIVNNGTQGSHDLKAVKDNVVPWYREQIEAALHHDMEAYILKFVKSTE